MIHSQRSLDLEQAEVILRQLEHFATDMDNIQGAEHLKHARRHIMGQLNALSIERAFRRSVPAVSRRIENAVPFEYLERERSNEGKEKE
jgi:hypothetical protein